MTSQLPQEFLDRLKIIHPHDFDNILQSFLQQRNGSFRVNTLKSSITEILQEFQEKNIEISEFPFLENVYIFDRKFEYAIKGTRAFYEGKIYLQSIASMLPVLALSPQKGEKILDVCAAPGSKTTQIAMIQENVGQIFALENNQIRADKLVYNCRLQGVKNVEIIKTDARKFLQNSTEMFDKILLDAPCSAEGRIFLENEKSFGFWSKKNILQKAELQNELLTLAWEKLKKGGVLLYSTCTLAPEENEMLISYFLQNHENAVIQDITIGLSDADFWRKNIDEFHGTTFENLEGKGIRILPSQWTEGFFMVKIGKR